MNDVERGGMATFLVVEARPLVRRLLGRQLGRFGAVCEEASVGSAAARLGEQSFAGLMLAAELPDGSGVALLQRLAALASFRADLLGTPPAYGAVVLLADHHDRALADRARGLGAHLLAGAPNRALIDGFARYALALQHLTPADADRVRRAASELDLTAVQTRLLAVALGHEDERTWARQLGVPRRNVQRALVDLEARAGVPLADLLRQVRS